MALCKFCNKWMTKGTGKREKVFCNSTCKSNYWYAINKKGRTDITPKNNTLIADEPGMFETQKQPLFLNSTDTAKLMRKLWEEKLEIISKDEYKTWLEKLDNSPLTKKQKELIKTTNQ